MCEALHLSLLRDNGEEKKEKGGTPPVTLVTPFVLKRKKETWTEYTETLTKKGTPCTIKKGLGVPCPSKIFMYEKM